MEYLIFQQTKKCKIKLIVKKTLYGNSDKQWLTIVWVEALVDDGCTFQCLGGGSVDRFKRSVCKYFIIKLPTNSRFMACYLSLLLINSLTSLLTLYIIMLHSLISAMQNVACIIYYLLTGTNGLLCL